MKKQYFIVIDGMDGCGKSEMVSFLHNYLFKRDKKFRILTTREPTSGTHGSKIRSMLAEEKNPDDHAAKLLDLFIADRKEHISDVVEPFLHSQKGDDVNIVVCDRYYHSTIAFQATQGIEREGIISKNLEFLTPDLTIILDIDPELALKRMGSRAKEKFEQKEFMEKLREQFLDLPKALNENIHIADASGSKHDVFEKIQKHVDALLEN